jgi:hypothetical protein
MRNCGVQAMLCPCIDCLNQKKLVQRELVFIIWSHVVSQKITRAGINMVRKALMNSKHVVSTSLGPLPRWVPGPTTRWARGTTRLMPHGT